MATTWIKPVHASNKSGGKTDAEVIKDTIDYVTNPDKTQDGYLVGTHQCNPFTADLEFADAKQDYFLNTGRKPQGDILVYHVRQSFAPGEITPEAAQDLGMKLAMELTGGNHSFVVATHDDTAHVHNHIIINAVNLECDSKYRNKIKSYKDLERVSNKLCAEHGYSVIDEPSFGTGAYKPVEENQPSHRDILVGYIDEALAAKPRDFDDFLKHLSNAGCKIKKRGKTISVQPPSGAERFFRFRTGKNGLPDGYDEESLRGKIADMWVGIDVSALPEPSPVMPSFEPETPAEVLQTEADPPPQQSGLNILLGDKIKNLIDLENSEKAKNSRGYSNWAKSFNLQQAAQTLLFLQENNLADVDELARLVNHARDEFSAVCNKVDTADSRLKEISVLQKNIGTYRKTRDIYSQYLRTKRNKDFYAKNENAIKSCEAAKEFFDKLGLDKIPTIKELQAEYASLVGEKQQGILQRDQLKKELADLQAAQKNIHALIGLQLNDSTAVRDSHEVR